MQLYYLIYFCEYPTNKNTIKNEYLEELYNISLLPFTSLYHFYEYK